MQEKTCVLHQISDRDECRSFLTPTDMYGLFNILKNEGPFSYLDRRSTINADPLESLAISE